jgi:hypothetical protein
MYKGTLDRVGVIDEAMWSASLGLAMLSLVG